MALLWDLVLKPVKAPDDVRGELLTGRWERRARRNRTRRASRAFDAVRNRTHDKDELKFLTAAIVDLATIKVR